MNTAARRAAVCGLIGLCAATGAGAADPMSPLPGMGTFGRSAMQNPPANPGLAASTAASPQTGVPAAGEAAGKPPVTDEAGRLVALRSDTNGKRDALIDDQWVRVGDNTRWGRVVAVHADRVELMTGSRASTPSAGRSANPRRDAAAAAARAASAAAEPNGPAHAAGRRTLYLLPRLVPTATEAVRTAPDVVAPTVPALRRAPSAPPRIQSPQG